MAQDKTTYMLVQLQVKYGRVGEFAEIMTHLKPALEANGWILRGAWANRIGRLNRCYDLWEMPDASHVRSVLEAASQNPEFAEWAAKLGDVLEDEVLEIMEPLKYFDAP